MKILLLDLSPVLYRWAFSSTTTAEKKMGVKRDENGLFDFDEYRDVYVYKVMDDLSKMKNRFGVDEVVLAADNGPYWRKELWSGYKYGRLKNDKTGVDWSKVKNTQQEMITQLDDFSSFKVLNIKRVEGDDSLFVLAKELTERGHEVIVKSVDHDIIYTLENEGVKYWRTKHNVLSAKCGFVEHDQEEIDRLKYEHCMFGDKGDYLLGATAFSVFSPEFKKAYPDMTELKAWPKRHEIDIGFETKTGVRAYKQPRFGETSFHKKQKKEGFTTEEFLESNPIYKMNYDLNEKLGLPEGIPDDIREIIIKTYDSAPSTIDYGAMSQYFLNYGIIELMGKTALF